MQLREQISKGGQNLSRDDFVLENFEVFPDFSERTSPAEIHSPRCMSQMRFARTESRVRIAEKGRCDEQARIAGHCGARELSRDIR